MVNSGKLNAAEQLATLEMVLEHQPIPTWTNAIDGGANCGDWAEVMAQKFENVYAFEPAPDMMNQLWTRVQKGVPNILLYEKALYSRHCWVDVVTPPKKTNPRSRFIQVKDSGSTEAVTVDSLGLETCGLLKLDLEGAEYDALLGATATVQRCKPVLIVELDGHSIRFGHTVAQTVELVKSFGYKTAITRGPDWVFTPQE